MAGLADPGTDLLVETPVTADHTADVFEVIDRLQLGAINIETVDQWATAAGAG